MDDEKRAWRERLERTEFFEDWPAEDLADLVAIARRRAFSSGEALWSVGAPSSGAFVLLSGRVQRTRHVRPDGLRDESFSEPGSLLALASLVQPWDHTSAAIAREPTEALALDRADFRALFEAGRPAAFHLVDAIASNLVHEMREANDRLHRVFGHPAETLRTLRRRVRDQSGADERGPA